MSYWTSSFERCCTQSSCLTGIFPCKLSEQITTFCQSWHRTTSLHIVLLGPRKNILFYWINFEKIRNGDTLGPVELIVWPEQGNQGDWLENDGQGEVSIIIFGMSKSSGFQKYSICWVFRHFVCVFVFVVVFVIVFVFVFVSSYDFWIAFIEMEAIVQEKCSFF